ncbi:MAG TPA: ABC transporter substrate-binding protein [Spirochaetaceae bacterium]|nr:ABC transporter substrate-binding protein [Spirochaetaceae bacterium]
MTRRVLLLATLVFVFLVAPLALYAAGTSEAVPGKEIELRWASIWVGQDSKAAPVNAIIAEFNAANAGKIKVVVDPQPDYNAHEQKIRTAIAAGIAPADIWTMKLNPTTAEFYNSPLLMDFTKSFKGDWKASFDAASVTTSTINGMLKSLPFEVAVLPIWFNMDLLAKVGVNAVPKTEAEFWSLMDKLKAAGISASSQMTGDTNAWTSMIWFSHFAISMGGPKVWSKPFTDPVFVKAAEYTKRMIVDYSTADAIGLGAGGSGGHFLAGRTALFSNGPWYAGRADLAATPFFKNITIAGLPAFGPTSNYTVSRIQANICAVATKDKAREAAIIEFLKYLSLPANVKRIAEASGAMFAVASDATPANHLQAQFATLAKNTKVSAQDLEAALGATATLEFGQQLSAFALGRISAAEFTKLVEAKIDR